MNHIKPNTPTNTIQCDVDKDILIEAASGKMTLNHNNFCKYLGEKYGYESTKGNVFGYDLDIWKPIEPAELRHIIKKELDLLPLSRVSKRDIDEVFELIKADSFSRKLGENLIHTNPQDINLKDCIYDAYTGETRPYRKMEYKFYKLPYHSSLINSSINPELFLSFLDEIFEGYENKTEIIQFIREYIAHLFLPITKFELGLFLYGNAMNGKGTLIRVIEHLLGEDNVSNLGIHHMSREEKVSSLLAKLANLDSEMVTGSSLDSADLKKIISGEKIEGRFLYKDPFFFRPHARIIIASNSMGKVKDFADNGAFRRFLFIHLKQSFGYKKDVDLKQKLLKELDLIFAWAIKGLPELLQRNEFNIPIELKDQTKEAFKEQDSFLIFFEEYLEKNHDSKIYNKVRYPLYKKFCRDTGEVTLSQIILSKRLIGLGFKSFGGNNRGFSGLSIKKQH